MNKQLHESMKADLHESVNIILDNLDKIQNVRADLTIGDVYETINKFGLSKKMAITIFGLEA